MLNPYKRLIDDYLKEKASPIYNFHELEPIPKQVEQFQKSQFRLEYGVKKDPHQRGQILVVTGYYKGEPFTLEYHLTHEDIMYLGEEEAQQRGWETLRDDLLIWCQQQDQTRREIEEKIAGLKGEKILTYEVSYEPVTTTEASSILATHARQYMQYQLDRIIQQTLMHPDPPPDHEETDK